MKVFPWKLPLKFPHQSDTKIYDTIGENSSFLSANQRN